MNSQSMSSIFRDPVRLADYFAEIELTPIGRSQFNSALPTPDQVARWSITDDEMKRCETEMVVLGAVGIIVTVMKNKPFDFYEKFIRQFASRLSMQLFGRYGLGKNEELIKIIEKYIEDLEVSMVEFSHTYAHRVFGGNPHVVSMIVEDMWKPAFDVAIETMRKSREFFVSCMAELISKRNSA